MYSRSYQTTVSAPASWNGVGLHTGAACRVTVRPAGPGEGISIRRVDREEWSSPTRLSPDMVVDTRLCTVLGHGHATIMTVEHLFAALSGLGVDNAVIEVDGPEIPAMDGSAALFVEGILDVGLSRSAAPRTVLRIVRPIEIDDGDRWACIEPSDKFELDVAIDFDNEVIGAQRVLVTVDPNSFQNWVAPARTFAMLRDVEALRASGLALGGSLENCVVIDDDKVVNKDGLRFGDEFVRHKALDALGDLFVLNQPVLGRYIAERPGHAINNAMARAILADPNSYRVESWSPVEHAEAFGLIAAE